MDSVFKKSVILSNSVKYLTYFSPITIILFTFLFTIIVVYNKRRARLIKLIERIPGPPALPIIGNAIEINVDHDGKKKYFSCG